MNSLIASAVCVAFLALALWHFYMALLPTSGSRGAVPSVEGRPVLVPSRGATLAVGIALVLSAGLVAVTGGLLPLVPSSAAFSWLSYALAFGLLARAVGEFKYVGFFKRVRGSRFATLDTFVYSPLCLLLAAGVAWVAMQNGT